MGGARFGVRGVLGERADERLGKGEGQGCSGGEERVIFWVGGRVGRACLLPPHTPHLLRGPPSSPPGLRLTTRAPFCLKPCSSTAAAIAAAPINKYMKARCAHLWDDLPRGLDPLHGGTFQFAVI